MSKFKRILILSVIFILIFSFNSFSMIKGNTNENPIAFAYDGNASLTDTNFFTTKTIAGQHFGNNTHGSCVAVAAGILLQYLDNIKNPDIVPSTVPQNWHTLCSGYAVNGKNGGTYYATINSNDYMPEALHKYLIALSQDNTFGIDPINIYNALNLYIQQPCLNATVYSIGGTLDDRYTSLRDIISNKKLPLIAFVNDPDVGPHCVVPYEYDGDYFWAHTGWNENPDPKYNYYKRYHYESLCGIIYINYIGYQHNFTYTDLGNGFHKADCTNCIMELTTVHKYSVISTNTGTHTLECNGCHLIQTEAHVWSYYRTYRQCDVCLLKRTGGGTTV